MSPYQFISLIAFLICIISLTYHFISLVKSGLPKDYLHKIGNIKTAVAYSFTGAMNPMKKESAYLHFPTYTAGILYHIGTFISVVLFFLFLSEFGFPEFLKWFLFFVLIVTGASGLGIFIKRITLKKLRTLSNPDDYISNLLVTAFQFFASVVLVRNSFAPYYYIAAGMLFLYLPLGKLKHSLYFFSARYHLGFFYGRRSVWPVKSHKQS